MDDLAYWKLFVMRVKAKLPSGEWLLGDPLSDLDSQEKICKGSIDGILEWGYFNPFGPTVCSLGEVHLASERTTLLVFRSLNPLEKTASVLGIIPENVRCDQELLYGFIQEALSRFSQVLHMMPNPPSYVLIEGGQLSEAQIRELIFGLAESFTSADLRASRRIRQGSRRVRGSPRRAEHPALRRRISAAGGKDGSGVEAVGGGDR